MDQKRRGGVRLRSRAKPRPAGDKLLLHQGMGAALGAGFALSSLGEGIAPFGIAYIAAASHPVFAGAGAFFTYVVQGGKTGLSSAAAVAVMLTCRLVLDETEAARRRYFYPLCAGVALLCTLGVTAVSLREGLLTLCAALLCSGFALLLRQARQGWTWGKLTALLGLLPALLPLRAWGFSPGMAAGAFVVLCASCAAGAAPGAAVGAVFGACADLTLGQAPFTALTLSLAGLGCGALREKGVRPCALSFAAVCGAVCLWLGKSTLFAEALAAAAAYTLLPSALRERIRAALSGLSRPAGRDLSLTLPALRQAVSGLREALAGEAPADPGDLSTVYRAACEAACRTCKNLSRCWQRDDDMRRMLSDAADALRARHGLEPGDLPPWFVESCPRAERFCGAVNDAYRESLRRQARQSREAAMQSVLSAQYDSMETLLGAALRRGAPDPVLEDRVSRVIHAYIPGAKAQVLTHDGRLRVDLLFPAGRPSGLDDPRPMVRSLEGALGVSLLPPKPVRTARGAAYTLTQRRLLEPELASCVRAKDGQEVCGDSLLHLITDDGRLILLLSDGMGTGEAANEASRRAVELVAGFARSGCSLASGVAAVLPVLAARFPQWGFVTLDLAEIDLFTGRASLLKYGAAPGLLLREGKLTRIASKALPAGLEPAGYPARPITLRLKPGDRLLLLSDGAWELPDPEQFFRTNGSKRPEAVAEEWIARAAAAGAGDDMSVLAVALHGAEEQEELW